MRLYVASKLVPPTLMAFTNTRRIAWYKSLASLSLNVVASRRLIRSGEIGGSIETVVFEPSMGKAVTAASKLVRFEDRLLGGVTTRIGVVETSLVELGMKSTDYVTTDGNLIETVVSGFFTLLFKNNQSFLLVSPGLF